MTGAEPEGDPPDRDPSDRDPSDGDTGLHRAIGLPHATAMVAGTIIGASIFVQPSEIAARVPSLGGTALAWLVCGVLTLFGALVCAELASTFPESGGVYVFLREAFSPVLGFLWGWAMFWTMHTGIIAAIAVVFARYLGTLIPLGPIASKAVAVTAIVALTLVNVVGVRQGSNLQTALTALKVLAIVLILAVGFSLGAPAVDPATSPAVAGEAVGEAAAGEDGESPVQSFLLALVAGLFAFGGWHMVTYNAGETIDPRRTIPRALLLGVALVTLCYIGLNAVYFRLLPLDVLIASDRVAADAADAVLGFGGTVTMGVLVSVSTFGALAGIVLAGPRVYHAMARDGLLFRWLGTVHPHWRTPHRALVLQAVWGSVLVATGSYRALFTRVIYTEWIFFGLLAVALFVLRRRPGLDRGFSVWGYPVVPAVFALSAFAIVFNQVAAEPIECLIGLSLVLAGLPVYLLWIRFRGTNPPGDQHSAEEAVP